MARKPSKRSAALGVPRSKGNPSGFINETVVEDDGVTEVEPTEIAAGNQVTFQT